MFKTEYHGYGLGEQNLGQVCFHKGGGEDLVKEEKSARAKVLLEII